jgi:hypothetical protein
VDAEAAMRELGSEGATETAVPEGRRRLREELRRGGGRAGGGVGVACSGRLTTPETAACTTLRGEPRPAVEVYVAATDDVLRGRDGMDSVEVGVQGSARAALGG